MSDGYYESFAIGDVIATEGRTVSEADVATFAGLSGDFEPLHMDEEFAKTSTFGTRIAHGLCTLAIVSGLLERRRVFGDVESIFLGLNIRFTKAVFLNDSVLARFEITEKRVSKSRPEWGIVTMHFAVLNQHQEIVQEGDWFSMVPLRPGS